MISSMTQAGRAGPRQKSLLILLAVVYTLVVLISSTHVHEFHELHKPKSAQTVDFSPAVVSLYQEIILEDHAEHWHSDQHNCASCKLQSGDVAINGLFSSAFHVRAADVAGISVHQPFRHASAHHLPRAPPTPVVYL
ncbi:MAG: hypothetical protein ACR2PT_14550 [Endozoicomonas sp.]